MYRQRIAVFVVKPVVLRQAGAVRRGAPVLLGPAICRFLGGGRRGWRSGGWCWVLGYSVPGLQVAGRLLGFLV